MIKKFSLKALEKAINFALALDDSSAEKLKNLEAKVVEIVISPLGIHFFLCFEKGRLSVVEQWEQAADVVIQSNPIGLIKLSFLPASKARSLFNDQIRLSGDTDLGQRVKQLFDELDIDWESHLAHFTGDVVAHQLGSFFRQGFAFKQKLEESIRYNLRDYLQEELKLFPPAEALEDFFNEVDKLSQEVERIEAFANLVMASYEIN